MLARSEWMDEAPARYRSGRALGRRIGCVLRSWQRRISEREELAGMGERDLRDARLCRADVLAEIRKPFWRA